MTTLLTSGWFWKGILCLVILTLVAANYMVDQRFVGNFMAITDLKYGPGVKAAIFALAAAALLFIALIPPSYDDQAKPS